jgi:hypothetical protein
MIPSIHASKNWGRRERLAVLGLMLAFVGFASYRLHSPGLYYDELLFVPAAMGRHEAFQMPYGSWLGLPIMIFPYIGAFKSVHLRPNFSALRRLGFDHPILISCGTLALG